MNTWLIVLLLVILGVVLIGGFILYVIKELFRFGETTLKDFWE